MRKESIKICEAFVKGRSAKAARTYTDGATIYLHGHPIARWDIEERSKGNRVLHLSCCGWPSTTTKDRLNTLLRILGLGAQYFTKNRQLYFGSLLRPVGSNEVISFDVDEAIALNVEHVLNTIAA